VGEDQESDFAVDVFAAEAIAGANELVKAGLSRIVGTVQ